ncbi:MAG TPA: methyltransferase domain-containing protein [Longimicrobiales bacterium]|nr:methyltransferase domain-containing protein [Longimicrobiales bacterium]
MTRPPARRRRLYVAAVGLAIALLVAAHVVGAAWLVEAGSGVVALGSPLLHIGIGVLLTVLGFKVLLVSRVIGIRHVSRRRATPSRGTESAVHGEREGGTTMHSLLRHESAGPADAPAVETRGRILDWGWRYDLAEWGFDRLLFRGKLRAMRMRTADLAGIRAGEAVLDVGCGTGTLALEAHARVGPTGRVVGVDPGTQQIARARRKAARRELPVEFQVGVIERLPFPDAGFDVVVSTIMMHHLPEDLRRRGLAEIRRVLKAGGRVAIADFTGGRGDRHGGSGSLEGTVDDLPSLLTEAGFSQVRAEEMRLPGVPGHPASVAIVAAVRD